MGDEVKKMDCCELAGLVLDRLAASHACDSEVFDVANAMFEECFAVAMMAIGLFNDKTNAYEAAR